MTSLYIDFDGVIVDSIDVTYKMVEDLGFEKNEENYSNFYQNLDWCDVLKKSKPIHDSWECIGKIIDSDKFNVAILTHVNSLAEIEEKVKIIRQHFRDITIIPVPKSISKTDMLKAEGSILVDDYVGNLDEWKAAGGYGIKFDLDMDGKGYPVIDRLDVLIDMIE
ncbi:MAG: hypothetical protein HFH47_00490 [Bacilli bacterium]|nr:hypothetical protein [Bacilli bacterium]